MGVFLFFLVLVLGGGGGGEEGVFLVNGEILPGSGFETGGAWRLRSTRLWRKNIQTHVYKLVAKS